MLKKQLTLFKKQGFIQFSKNKLNKCVFVLKKIWYYPYSKSYKWDLLKDKYIGQRVFLIGNGPSLNKTPLYLLKNENVMCFNRFHLMFERVNWKPKFYTIVDNLVLDDLLNEFDKVTLNSESVFIPAVHPQGDVFVNRVKDDAKVHWFKNKTLGSGFSTTLPDIYGGGSVIYEGFQILKHLGFGEIVLLGVDMNYQIHKSVKLLKNKSNNIQSLSDDDPNHFDPRYFGKGKKYHQPEKDIILNILNGLKYISKINKDLGFNIINASFDSKVDFFPKKNIFEVLNIDKEISFDLFQDCITSNTKYGSIKELTNSSIHIFEKDYTDLDFHDNYYTETSFGLLLVKKYVYTHVCYGPYENQLFFVCRKNIINT
jgi:hypothetical protein